MNRRLWVVAGVLLVAAAVFAQQKVTESVQVVVVEVPVTVVDRDGNSVRDLTKENFELYDEGKRVPIEYFEMLDLPEITKQQTTTALPPAATRHFLLMFDLANSSPGTIKRAGGAAKDFVDQLGKRDLAAVATFSVENGARMITNFTRNRTLLVNAIETLGHPSYFKVGDPLMLSAVRSGGSADIGKGGPDTEAVLGEMARESEVIQQKSQDAERRERLRTQLRNMGSVARALDRLNGQKQIILLSEGFDASLVTGRENLSSEEAKNETSDALSGEVWKVDTDKRYGSSTSSGDIDDMVSLFRRSDVVLHAIDIKGLRGSSDVTSMSAGGSKKSFESLYLLTKPLGGTVFKNANDLTDNFTKLMKQQEVVYLLGFTAKSADKPGKFHNLKVKAVNARGGRVTHRAGYYEPAPLTNLERNLTAAEIMMTDAPIDDVTVNVTAVPLPGPSGRARVPVMLEMPGERLLQGLTGNTATAQVLLYAFDKDSQVIDFVQDKITLDLVKAGPTVRAGGVRYYATLRLPPGDYAVKALVRVDESAAIGFKRNDLSVPTFTSATVVPPVLFSEAGNWAMILGPSRGDNYAYPFAAGEAKYIPKRDPLITASGDYKVALFLAKVPLENLSLVPTLVTGGTSKPADLKLIGRTSPDESGLYTLIFQFKPSSIAAGHHELRFDVKTKDGVASAVTLPFTIQ